VRLKQLAFELGLSVTTVSRALAGYDDVARETRKRVFEAAERSGYLEARTANRPPRLAPGGPIGMLLPLHGTEIIDPNVTRFVAGLTKGLMRHGRDLLLTTVSPGQDDLTVLRHMVETQRVAGLVMHRLTQDDPCVRFLCERKFPFVTLGRVLAPHAPHPWFDMDAEAGFAAATRLLLKLGHRRFALFGPAEPFSYAALRRRGVEQALAAAGLTLDCVSKAPVPDPVAIARAADALLDRRPRPTAVLGVLDKYALAVLEAARRRGLLVPDELSVIGFGDIPEAGFSNPRLSTFAQHSTSNGEAVADMIVNLIEEEGGPVGPELVAVDFVARESHGPAPKRLARATGLHALA
jgi:LacI family transcriptional regulator